MVRLPPTYSTQAEIRVRRDVDVWVAKPSNFCDAVWPVFACGLDATERVRLGKFRLERDRRSFLLLHVLKRRALAEHLELRPSHLRFGRTETGRPYLVEPANSAVGFSLSRTPDLVACAVTEGREIGIDIESCDRLEPDPELLAPFITADTLDLLSVEDQGERRRRFGVCWTVVEAFGKALGHGLSSENPKLSISFGSDGRASLAPSSAALQTNWEAISFEEGSEHHGSIVVAASEPMTSGVCFHSPSVGALLDYEIGKRWGASP
jgi:4'-phosphopantetheinyl transferase